MSLADVLDAAARLAVRQLARLAPALAAITLALALAGPRWTPAVLASEPVIAVLVAAPSLAIALRRAGAALAVIALVFLVASGVGLALVGPALASTDTSDLGTLVVIALWLVVVLALHTRWLVAVPAIVLERPGVIGALRRSGALTAGHRGPIAAILVLLFAAFVLATIAVDALAGNGDSRWFFDPDAAPVVAITGVALWLVLAVGRAAFARAAFDALRGAAPEHVEEVFS